MSREEGSRAIQMKLGKAEDGFRTPGYDEAEILEKSHAQAEQLRLLYVAATRARDQLVVPFMRVEKAERSKGDSKSLNDYLIRIKADEVPVSIDAALLPEHVGDVPALRADLEDGTEHDTRCDHRDTRGVAGRTSRAARWTDRGSAFTPQAA